MAAWLADLSWPAVVGVMVLALAIAWLVEWVSWREAQAARLAAPRLDRHVEPPPARPPEPEPEPASAPALAPSVVEPAPPAAEPVPESVVVEADHDPVPVPPAAAEEPEPTVPEPVEAGEPEPAVPEPVEPAPETQSGETGERSEPGGTSIPDESEALAPRARRSWRGMSLRRVEPPEATTPGELPAPAERDRTEYPERPATAHGVKPPFDAESRPEPEERPAYAPPRGLPPPEPDEIAPVVPRAPANVVRMPQSATPREWNLWELESLAREQARLEPERGAEWSYLFVHLRQFADVKGKLPSEFDGLVRESFGELLDSLEPV